MKDLLRLLFKDHLKSNYTIIKLNPKFPELNYNSDIDFFAESLSDICNEFKSRLQKQNFKHKVLKKNNYHWHLDIYDKNKLSNILKLDFYSKLPNYKVVKIKDSLFVDTIKSSKMQKFKLDDEDIYLKLPSDYYNLILRYIEYYEFFWTGHPKNKHLDYIFNNLNSDRTKIVEFTNLVHFYLSLPDNFQNKYSDIVVNYKNKMSFRYYVKKILSKLR